MEKKEEYVEVDLLQLLHALWHKAWVIAAAILVMGALAFGFTKVLVTPMYKSQIIVYINNNAASNNSQLTISQGDLNAAKSLVDTYTVILKTRETLCEVIEKAHLPYSYEQLYKMVTAASVNSTEIFYVRATAPDPYEAQLIANTIGEVLPDRISQVVDGSSVRIVDEAVVPTRPASPNLMKNVALGMILGLVLSCAVIVIMELTDNQIHDPDYLTQTYDLPVLAVIPDLLDPAARAKKAKRGGTDNG